MKLSAYQTRAKEVIDKFKTNVQSGLSQKEVEKRRQTYGANALPRPKRKSYLLMLLQQLNNAFLYLLMAYYWLYCYRFGSTFCYRYLLR